MFDMLKRDVLVAAVFLIAGASAGYVYAGEQKIQVCHTTGSAKNPYVLIKVSVRALDALENGGDFILPAGATSCTKLPPPPPAGGGNN